MESDRERVEIDYLALGEAVAETEALLAMIDSAPRSPDEDPFDFLRALREARADRDE